MTRRDRFYRRERRINERPIIGLLIIAAGVVILLRNLDFPFPDFLFSWPMILILIGSVLAIRDGFRPGGWIAMVALGGFFMAMRMFPDFHISTFFWPAILITVGASFLLGRGLSSHRRRDTYTSENFVAEDTSTRVTGGAIDQSTDIEVLDIAAVFGAVKKNVYAKNFQGGEIVTVFGGSEVNLTHADFASEIKIEVVNIFGGTKLIIPPHWQIRSEAVAVFGGIEDKRPRPAGISTDKIIVLEGFVMFGGIEIKSM